MSIELVDSVGSGGANRKPDTRRVQAAPNEI